MDTLTASSVSSRPWVLQFFRNLFGSSRHVRQEEQGTKADVKDKQVAKSELLDSPLPDTEARLSLKNTEPGNSSFNKISEGVMDSHPEKLSGHLKEISLGDTISTTEKRLSTLLESTGLEMGDSDGFADSAISNLAYSSSEKFSASSEKKGDRGTLGKDEISQAMCVNDEGVSTPASSLILAEDCSAEEERECLLKADVRVEPPKAELSPWNRLINMYKQRRRLPASKVTHLQPLGLATSRSHITLPDSPEAACVCGFPENESGDLAVHCEAAQGGARSDDTGSTLDHPKASLANSTLNGESASLVGHCATIKSTLSETAQRPTSVMLSRLHTEERKRHLPGGHEESTGQQQPIRDFLFTLELHE